MSNGDDENKTKLKFLSEAEEYTRKVETLIEDISQMLRRRDSSVLDSVKPILEPRRKAMAVVDFYNTFFKSSQEFQKVSVKIEESGIAKKYEDPETIPDIAELESLSILDLLKSMINEGQSLEKYRDIRIVAKLLETNNKKIETYLLMIQKTALGSLNRLPRVADKLDVYTRFILKHCDGDEYLKEYTRIFHNRLSFADIKNNEDAIIQQTKDLTEHFNVIMELNKRILGRRVAKTINEGVVKVLVFDLKNIIGTHLMKIDKTHSPDRIPFLIKLYANIRHREGNMVEELELLFDLKPEIMKLIFNCFIQFFGQLDLLEKPNENLAAEEVTVLLANILDEFALNKEAKREWTTSYARSFGVPGVSDLDPNFSEKCLLRVSELANQFEIGPRSIYMINNIHVLREHFTKFSGLEIKQLIYKYCESIIGLIKVELGPKTPTEAYKYLTDELSAVQKYCLPEEQRTYISQALKALVEDRISRKLLQGNPQTLLKVIAEAYTGKVN